MYGANKPISIVVICSTETSSTTWPLRNGEYKSPGDSGNQHDFALSVCLQNCFSIWKSLGEKFALNYSFRQLCESLSDELFEVTLNL